MKHLQELSSLFATYPEVKLVYLFGSRVSGRVSPGSDYDFAVYLDTKDKTRMHEIRLELYAQIGHLLGDDRLDIVILNLIESPELKYAIITGGKLLFEREPFRLLVEPRILNEYFDFRELLLRYNLTRR